MAKKPGRIRKKKRLSIGILVADRKQRKPFLQLYGRYVPPKVSLYAFHPASITGRGVRGLGLRNRVFQAKRFPLPDVVYNRCYGIGTPALENLLGRRIPHFNQRNQFNKEETDRLLRSSGLFGYLPDTAPYAPEGLKRMLEQHGTVVLKPSMGSRGYGVYRIELKDTGEVHISQHHFAPWRILPAGSAIEPALADLTGGSSYLIQSWIPSLLLDGKVFDIRVLVQKNRTGRWGVTNIISRVSYSGCFNTSMCGEVYRTEMLLGRIMPPERIQAHLDSLRDISLCAAAGVELHSGMHLGEVSVDFALGEQDRLWIIEMNGQPQKSIYRELKISRDVYRNPMEYARYLMSRP